MQRTLQPSSPALPSLAQQCPLNTLLTTPTLGFPAVACTAPDLGLSNGGCNCSTLCLPPTFTCAVQALCATARKQIPNAASQGSSISYIDSCDTPAARPSTPLSFCQVNFADPSCAAASAPSDVQDLVSALSATGLSANASFSFISNVDFVRTLNQGGTGSQSSTKSLATNFGLASELGALDITRILLLAPFPLLPTLALTAALYLLALTLASLLPAAQAAAAAAWSIGAYAALLCFGREVGGQLGSAAALAASGRPRADGSATQTLSAAVAGGAARMQGTPLYLSGDSSYTTLCQESVAAELALDGVLGSIGLKPRHLAQAVREGVLGEGGDGVLLFTPLLWEDAEGYARRVRAVQREGAGAGAEALLAGQEEPAPPPRRVPQGYKALLLAWKNARWAGSSGSGGGGGSGEEGALEREPGEGPAS
jgi:hypothetical protein